MGRALLRPSAAVVAALLCACSADFDPPFLNYRDCEAKTSAEQQRKGVPQVKARLDARDHCRKLYGIAR